MPSIRRVVDAATSERITQGSPEGTPQAKARWSHTHIPSQPASSAARARRTASRGSAFSTFLLPLLGIIFLPFATLIYVIVYTPGVGLVGFDWFWVILAVLLDIGSWGATYTQRDQIPGTR